MIVWGSKGEVKDLGQQFSRHCATCEKERPFHLMLQYTVAHICYVFRWVSSKQYASVCNVCRRGERLDAKAVEAKLAKPPIPWGTRWSWTILAGMVAVAGVFGTMNDLGRGSDREKYVAAPQKGDRYIVNASSLLKSPQSKYMYGVFRVRDVKADALEFDAATVFYSGASGVEKDMRAGKLDTPGYFGPTPLVLTRAEVERLHQEHAIWAIER